MKKSENAFSGCEYRLVSLHKYVFRTPVRHTRPLDHRIIGSYRAPRSGGGFNSPQPLPLLKYATGHLLASPVTTDVLTTDITAIYNCARKSSDTDGSSLDIVLMWRKQMKIKACSEH